MNKIQEIIARVMGIKEVKEDASPETIEAWDSFNQIMLVSELETGFGINFTMDDIQKLGSYKQIKSLLESKGVFK